MVLRAFAETLAVIACGLKMYRRRCLSRVAGEGVSHAMAASLAIATTGNT